MGMRYKTTVNSVSEMLNLAIAERTRIATFAALNSATTVHLISSDGKKHVTLQISTLLN